MSAKYLNYEGLQTYDNLIKGVISDGDAKALKTFQYDEATRTLKFFKSEAPETDAVADFNMTLPDDVDISGLLEKIDGGVVDNIVTIGEDGTVKDSGIAINDVATKTEVENVQKEVDAVEVSVTELEGRVTTAEGKITTLVGDDANKSVRTIANEELAKQLIADGAKESLDTLEEIAAWIQSHPNDASAMSKAIDDLEALVGTIPEDATANTIVGYIDELITQVKGAVKEVKSGTTNGTIAVDGTDVAVTGLGSAAYKSDTDFDSSGSANAAEVNSKAYADTLNTAMDTRVTALEDATPIAITEDEISNLFS